VAYAHDYVICCRGDAEQAMVEMRWLMLQLKLAVNDAKTHIRRLPQERFAFLGYDFSRYYSAKTGRAYLCGNRRRRVSSA
jgi:RNA-directed DNA polymerase